MSQDVPMITLNNGVQIPQLGLGTWKLRDGDEAKRAVSTALRDGYRLIDTAKLYGNERSVGEAINASGIKREDIFVTTKLWNDCHQYEQALQAFDESMERLGLEYVDMYLIHWPVPGQDKYLEAWRALERLHDQKRIRAIGVSNFLPTQLERLLKSTNVVPVVNQIELNPMLQQREIREFCAKHDIAIEAYSPLMRGGSLLSDPVILTISEKYGKTPAQTVLRWHIDSGLIAIPKSSDPNRIEQNIDIFDFSLDETDMNMIAKLDSGHRAGT